MDWWEWSDQALAEARERDVPVLLSVGYAACHWCHVMAHESFEDEETAALMNRLFVNVKVDREERPDVDAVYMESVQAMTGHGGWPMTVFIDHDGRPFFAGTYFPKDARHGMPSFQQVLIAISSAWTERRSEVEEQGSRLVEAISQDVPSAVVPADLAVAYEKIEAVFDPFHGGFGQAPKFPQQPVIEFLLRIHEEDWAPQAAGIVIKTLEEMSAGGIHDQLGGGFARYSVDNRWLVPHFEKMLYDNAQLARLYLWAGVEFGRDDFIETARTTLRYMATDLRHPEGGFYSSEDADSEGEEGRFYVWSVGEVRDVLGEGAEAVITYYGLTAEGNFEGSNILNVVDDTPPAGLEAARDLLLKARNLRVRPGLDDKVVAAWNGLAIRAFAEAGAALRDEALLDLARDAAGFVLDNLMVGERLMRSWREERTSVTGFVEDYAAMAVGLYGLFSATGEIRWYEAADRLVQHLSRFARDPGGFHTTSVDGQTLVKRPFDLTDNPQPSGNALAAEALFYSGLLTGDSDQRDQFEAALTAAGVFMERHPTMVSHHLSLVYSSRRSQELAIIGPDWRDLARVHTARFRPHIALAPSPEPTDRIPVLAERSADGGGALAYLCRDFVCDLPTSDPEQLAAMLD